VNVVPISPDKSLSASHKPYYEHEFNYVMLPFCGSRVHPPGAAVRTVSTTTALQISSAGAPFERAHIERRDLRPGDLRIDIDYAGICHTDLHYGQDDFGRTPFPLVPGHEIAGTVGEIGEQVEGFEVGDRVGMGCMCNSCCDCRYCVAGQQQFCIRGTVLTYGAKDYDGTITEGGYSRSIVVDSRFVLRIPDAIALEDAAPLLCAGITMYSPLRHWHADSDKKVAIVGMGGLGHLGVKLAVAMGSDVTVLSQSLAKEEDGRRFGASDFRATADPATFEELAGTFDLILNTVSSNVDVNSYLGLLAADGILVTVGIPDGEMTVSPFALLRARRSLAGTSIGGIQETQEMLDFCAAHGIRPEIELVSAEPATVDEAWKRVAAGKARYRVVIDTVALASTDRKAVS
jgi:uncharacterized zinc-type alcohol dehydrogenase-like protein